MADIYHPSEGKYKRATEAVNRYHIVAVKKANRADIKLVVEGKGKKLEGDALIQFVYEGLKGAPALKGVEAKEAIKKSSEAKNRAKKRTGMAAKREKITVK